MILHRFSHLHSGSLLLTRARHIKRQESKCSPAMRRGGSQRISPSCRGCCGSLSPSIRMTPRVPRRRRRFRQRRVRTGSAVPANPAHVSQALFKSCEPAIPGATTIAIAIGAPRTVLRLSGFFDPDDGGENSQNYRQPHVRLLIGLLMKTPAPMIYFQQPR